jgi:hypothetical protein
MKRDYRSHDYPTPHTLEEAFGPGAHLSRPRRPVSAWWCGSVAIVVIAILWYAFQNFV